MDLAIIDNEGRVLVIYEGIERANPMQSRADRVRIVAEADQAAAWCRENGAVPDRVAVILKTGVVIGFLDVPADWSDEDFESVECAMQEHFDNR